MLLFSCTFREFPTVNFKFNSKCENFVVVNSVRYSFSFSSEDVVSVYCALVGCTFSNFPTVKFSFKVMFVCFFAQCCLLFGWKCILF